MHIFKFFKKLFKKYYFKKDLFSSSSRSPNQRLNKKKIKKIDFETEARYNEFYSSPAWKNYQQKEEMDIFLHRNKNKEILTTPLERIERIKTIMEGFLSGEINFNSEEWYEKNKYKLWKYANRKRANKH